MEIVQGIILKTSPYSETQKIIRIYTKEKGYLSMISPSVVFKRKTKTVHLLQISEIEFFENEKSDLHKLRLISPIIDHIQQRIADARCDIASAFSSPCHDIWDIRFHDQFFGLYHVDEAYRDTDDECRIQFSLFD